MSSTIAPVNYDLLVIGGGSGGVRAARLVATTGARVALMEKQQLGGTCVNVGCVPKKLFYYAAGFAKEWQVAADYGYPMASLGDRQWLTLRQNKDREIRRLNGVYQQLLEDAGVHIINATAYLDGPHTVIGDGQTVQAESILLASGSRPVRPALPGSELAVVSDDLFALPALPKRVILIGGGYIALEFAGIFNGLGVETTLLCRGDLPMRGLDDDVRQQLAQGIAEQGVNLKTSVSPLAIEEVVDGKRLTVDDGTTLTADLIVFATGRRPNSADLGIERVNITARPDGTIPVDECYRSHCPSIYAIGDLLQTPALTPVAIAEAEVLVKRKFGNDLEATVDYDAVPTAVFSRPSLATTGLGEKAASQRGIPVAVYTQIFRPMKSGFAGQPDQSLIKLIVNSDNQRVVGACMIGEQAADIIQGIAIAIKSGAKKRDFDETIGIHPTSAEEFVTLRKRIR